MIDLYFDWLTDFVSDMYPGFIPSRNVINVLFETPYRYSNPDDANREEDGIDLRYLFGAKYGFDQHEIAVELDNRPCSVLEMMVALCIKCEEQYMYDPEHGYMYGRWFKEMLDSLGITRFSDSYKIACVLENFMDNKYDRDGHGGLYILKGRTDVPSLPIWTQMCLYLDQIMY